MMPISELEQSLNSFSREARFDALKQLVALAQQGQVKPEAERDIANMHAHTFYSFNAYGHSPASLAWIAKQRGFKLIGTVDFDVLDAVDEFFSACDLVGVRGGAGLETRVHISEFSTREINSPGEPGVFYHMGIGFTSSRAPETVAPILASMRQRAEQRNREMVKRINAYLAPVAVDYDQDVLPLTPAGNATERHLLVAYVRAAEKIAPDPVAFWADKLGLPREKVAQLASDLPQLYNVVRLKLMKRGGVGYVVPTPESFPTVEEVNRLVAACGALPCATWSDGTSQGEQAMEELLELLIGKGVVALNLIPDRCWNVADLQARRVKVQNMHDIVRLAQRLDLVVNAGTEMNAAGQKLVDDFDVPEMLPIRQAILDGAFTVYGHTALQRALGLGYQSAWAKAHLPTRRERNGFYRQAGQRIAPGLAGLDKLKRLDTALPPAAVLAALP